MKQFDMDKFNLWIQDNQDYHMISDTNVYIERKSNDCITYCIEVLGMIPQDAWIVANNVHIKESKRLGI